MSKKPLIDEIINKLSGYNLKLDELEKSDIDELRGRLNELTDVRECHKRFHKLSDIVLLCIFAQFSGATTWVDIEIFAEERLAWLNKYDILKSRNIPSHDTIQRVLGLVKHDEMEKIITEYLINKIKTIQRALKMNENQYIDDNLMIDDILNIDGKEIASSGKKSSKSGAKKNINILTVYSSELGVSLFSKLIDSKSNEIPTSQEILNHMDLKGKLITCDALNTQANLTKIIAANKGHYVLALKNNHKSAYNDFKYYLDNEQGSIRKNGGYYSYREQANSKIITREYYVTNDIKWFQDLDKWHNLKAIGLEVKTTVDKNSGKINKENRYYLLSFFDVRLFALATRRHWNIESMHWHLDVTFVEDKNTTSDSKSILNLNTIRKMAITILKLAKGAYSKHNSVRSIKYRLSLNYETNIEKIISFINISDLIDVLNKG